MRFFRILLLLLISGTLTAKGLAVSGVEQKAHEYRPMRHLFHSISLKARLELYRNATRLFRKELEQVGFRFRGRVVLEWERTVRPLFLKPGDLKKDVGEGVLRIERFLQGYIKLNRQLLLYLKEKGRDASTMAAALNSFIDRNDAALRQLKEEGVKISALMRTDRKAMSYLMKNMARIMAVMNGLKKIVKPYLSDSAVKAAVKRLKF